MFNVVLLLPLVVGLIWGSTNIAMKCYSKTKLKCFAFFLLNQCASVLLMLGFKYTRKCFVIFILEKKCLHCWTFKELSKGVAIANSTALFTSALMSYCLCKEKIGWSGTAGVLLICIGIGLLND
uniref:EamA domain-containing protein n=1 Tax=Trichobilharzia regenti TaxID=157069 RepID=A0AA85JSG3_TRIRE|nr:unnamed protein product [Trichobilharzia regenti]